MIKCLVSDMDGTLFAGHGETVFDLTPRNQEALRRVQQAGILFCVASGRMIGYGQRLLERYGFSHGLAAGFNGGICCDGGRTVVSHPMDMGCLRYVMETVEREFPRCEYLQIQTLTSLRIFSRLDSPVARRYREDYARLGLGRVADFTIAQYLDGPGDNPPAKATVKMSSRQECLAVKERIQAAVEDKCYITFSGDSLMEVGSKAGGKGGFVRYLRQAYHLEREEVAVIGDALNDTQMFPEAGLTFAMASGDEAVKAMADVVVADVAECIDLCIRRNREEAGR